MSDQPDVPMIDPSQGWGGKLSDWFKQHWTTTIIIAIIAFLIWGIYSNYTAENAENTKNNPLTENTSQQEKTNNNENIQENENTNVADNTNAAEIIVDTNTQKSEEKITETKNNNEKITATAVKGNGVTHLARKALKKYLETNSDTGLTKEHKIFIEDYMRKQVPCSSLKVGESRDFSINLIQEAVNNSKKLTDKQLNNLKKYSSRVPNL